MVLHTWKAAPKKERILSMAIENRTRSNQIKLQQVDHARHKRKYSNDKDNEELVLIAWGVMFAALEVFFKTRLDIWWEIQFE